MREHLVAFLSVIFIDAKLVIEDPLKVKLLKEYKETMAKLIKKFKGDSKK